MTRLLLALIPLLALVGCSDSNPEPEAPSATSSAQVFRVKGVIQKVKAEGEIVIIDHEEIPDFMVAMVMPFFTKDAGEVAGLKPGDRVEFDYVVEERSSWIEKVEKTGEGGEIKTDDPDPEPPASLVEIGQPFPDYEFVSSEGKDVKLSDFRGAPLVFTFVFTRCPVPEFCPAMMLKFHAVDAMLKDDPQAPKDWHLLTISFDADFDTPEVMAAYGERFRVEKSHWTLLTSDSCCTINEIAGNVGLKFGEKGGSYQHNLRTAVLDADGVLRHLFTDETWQPETLAEAIRALGGASS